ncbi:MAG: hypothetical protein ABWY00_13895 [Dongiaceae bacterium]
MATPRDDEITAAIAAAESRTAAEIVVAILSRADPYRLTAVLAAFAVAALATVAVELLLLPALSLRGVLPREANIIGFAAVLLLGIAAYLFCERTSLGVRLTVSEARREACATRARLLFLQHGIDATADRLGLLVFVSHAEHHIEILPDRGIAAIVPSDRWSVLIAGFTDRVGQGGLENSLTQLIAEIADELAPAFPPRADQANDLPDAPIRV